MKIYKSEYIDSMKVKVYMTSLDVLKLLCIKKSADYKVVRWEQFSCLFVFYFFSFAFCPFLPPNLQLFAVSCSVRERCGLSLHFVSGRIRIC